MALSLRHRSDATLLQWIQSQHSLAENTLRSLQTAAQAARQPMAANVEEIKDQMLRSPGTWPNFHRWIAAMGKLYQDPEGWLPRRRARSSLQLTWRAEPWHYPLEPRVRRPPSHAAKELNELMEREAITRSAALHTTNTDPQTRRQLLAEESRIAQAYHYLAARSRDREISHPLRRDPTLGHPRAAGKTKRRRETRRSSKSYTGHTTTPQKKKREKKE